MQTSQQFVLLTMKVNSPYSFPILNLILKNKKEVQQ